MTYVPKDDPENFNVSESSPLKDFFILVGGVGTVLVIILLAAGWLGEFMAVRLSPETEKQIFGGISSTFSLKEFPLGQQIADKLGPESGAKIFLLCDHQANAFAMLGYHIAVTSGLLKEVKTENGLAFVIAHELGHFEGRHHVRGLGRTLGIGLVLGVLGFSVDNSGFLNLSSTIVERSFSRTQESEADQIAIEKMLKTYGHLEGATEFFENIQKKDTMVTSKWPTLFFTHPITTERIEKIKAQGGGLEAKEVVPLDIDSILTVCESTH